MHYMNCSMPNVETDVEMPTLFNYKDTHAINH